MIWKRLVCVQFWFLNELEPICLHTSITIISTQLNDFNYCYLTLIIAFNINHLLAHWSGYKYYYVSLPIQLNISHLFTYI